VDIEVPGDGAIRLHPNFRVKRTPRRIDQRTASKLLVRRALRLTREPRLPNGAQRPLGGQQSWAKVTRLNPTGTENPQTPFPLAALDQVYTRCALRSIVRQRNVGKKWLSYLNGKQTHEITGLGKTCSLVPQCEVLYGLDIAIVCVRV